MEDGGIQKLIMPKWGLSMAQGKVVEWLIDEGTEISAGAEVVEVETEKITGAVESPVGGTLRRLVAQPGQDVPVGGLLAVIADPSLADEEIQRFVESFVAEEVEDDSQADVAEPASVDVGDLKLRYLQRGEGGEPVVLVHGFTGNLNNWLFNHGPLAEGRAVYALDLPGHGRSSKDVGDGSLEFLTGALRGWLDALEIPAAHFVAHSMGGSVALALALSEPERVLSCTLIGSTGLGSEIDADYIAGVVNADRRKQLKPYLERLFADGSRVTRQLVDDVLKFKRLDGVGNALRLVADNFVVDGQQAWVFRDRLAELSVPLLVVWGAHDQIVPARHAAGLPHTAEVQILDDCGHMVQMEAAGEVNRLILRFLEQV